MAAVSPNALARETHPAVLQSVVLSLQPTTGETVVLHTKVLDVESSTDDGMTIVVSCPEGLDPLEHHFDAQVSWTYPLGRMECPVTTRPGRRPYGRVWLVRPSGPPTRLQQREYFRASISVPVQLTWSAPEEQGDRSAEPQRESHWLLGVVIDISEGGLLASTRSEVPAVGTAVECVVLVEGEELLLAATVVRHVRFAGGGAGVAVAFAEPDVHGDRLRRLAFEAERRRRRG